MNSMDSTAANTTGTIKGAEKYNPAKPKVKNSNK